MDPEVNNNFYKELGLAADDWVLYDEDLAPFFEWLSDNITQDNLLSELETREYEDILKSGQVISGDELELEIQKLKVCYPGILSYTNDDVQHQQNNLDNLLEIEKEQEKILHDIKSSSFNQTKDIDKLILQITEFECMQKKSSEDCLSKALDLKSLQQSSIEQVNQITQSYLQDSVPPVFIYQMPLDQYNIKTEQYLKYLEVYMKKNFNIQDYQLSDEEGGLEGISEDLESVRERISNIQVKLARENIDINGMQFIIDKMEQSQWKPMSLMDLKRVSGELELDNEHKTLQLEALKQELEMHVRDLNDQQIQILLLELSRNKVDRGNSRLDKINIISHSVDKVSMNAEMVWILLQMDLEKLNSKVDHSEDLYTMAQDCSKRIELMRQLDKQEDGLEENFLKKLIEVFTEGMGSADQVKNIQACLQEVNDFKRNMDLNLNEMVNKKSYKLIEEQMAEMDNQLKILHDFVFNGPTTKPQLFDPKFMEEIQSKASKTKAINNQFQDLCRNYKNKYLDPLSEDKFFKYNDKLWVYFLMEPKKVLLAIKEVSEFASKTSSKSIGLKCKPAIN